MHADATGPTSCERTDCTVRSRPAFTINEIVHAFIIAQLQSTPAAKVEMDTWYEQSQRRSPVRAAENSKRLTLISLADAKSSDGLEEAVRQGLSRESKTLPCRYFYDEVGSEIFEQICDLPEYYLTRAEHEILRDRAPEIAGWFEGPTTVVELGSGSSTKTRVLIEAFLKRHGALKYVPLDISKTMLEESAKALLGDYPALEIFAIAAEYGRGLARIREEEQSRKLIVFLGSSIGNFRREDAASFLREVRATMRPDDRLLLGIDLRKSADVLENAYDDAAGVTARFNKNILSRINTELAGDFELDEFAHQAVVNEEVGRVEMHLVSRRSQQVRLDALDLDITFDEHESIHTENSYKYSPGEIDELAASADLRRVAQWLDTKQQFSLSLFAPECSS